LYIGISDDSAIEHYMTLNERVLCVLAQKNVDDVIIGAPSEISEALLDGYKIEKVIQSLEANRGEVDISKLYQVPLERGILNKVEVESKLCKEVII